MCGRYSVLTEDEIIEVRLIIRDLSLRLASDDLREYAVEHQQAVFPTNKAPVVTSNGSETTFELGQFGFEKWNGEGVIINARAETIKEKSMFKQRIQQGRCVVPASGYYEWKLPGEGQKKKIKHMIKDKDGNLLFMAGLWRDGINGKEFVIITKEPFGEIKDIHDRMPVILKTDQIEAWLSGKMVIEELSTLDHDCTGTPSEEASVGDTQAGANGQMSFF